MAITRYSVNDYEEMIRLGVLTENDRVELIRGEIVPKMPIGDRHFFSVNRINRRLPPTARRGGDHQHPESRRAPRQRAGAGCLAATAAR